MRSKADIFIDKVLGEDFIESLVKFELWKPGTKTVVDHEEIKTGLKIVPKLILSILISELAPMVVDESKEINLPLGENVKLVATKLERDVYTGRIEEANKILVDFKNRSIPGIGLVIMSAFELYNVDEAPTPVPVLVQPVDDIELRVQKMIDERLALHHMVNQVVDNKLKQREAVHQMVLSRLSDALSPAKAEKSEMNKGTDKLHQFIQERSKKIKKNEFSAQLAKVEHMECPDCGKQIFSAGIFSGCICLGDDMDKKIYIRKTENDVKIRFGKGWDTENIELLLELLRRKNG